MADKPHGTLEHDGATSRCLLCDATRTRIDIVVFIDHGAAMDQGKAHKAKATPAPAQEGLEKYAAIIAASLNQ